MALRSQHVTACACAHTQPKAILVPMRDVSKGMSRRCVPVGVTFASRRIGARTGMAAIMVLDEEIGRGGNRDSDFRSSGVAESYTCWEGVLPCAFNASTPCGASHQSAEP